MTDRNSTDKKLSVVDNLAHAASGTDTRVGTEVALNTDTIRAATNGALGSTKAMQDALGALSQADKLRLATNGAFGSIKAMQDALGALSQADKLRLATNGAFGSIKAMQDALGALSQADKLRLATNGALGSTKAMQDALGALSQADKLRLATNGTLGSIKAMEDALGTISNIDSIPRLTNVNSPSKALKTQIREISASPPRDVTILHTVSDIGVAIRNVRKSKNLTQQNFADIAGVGRRFLSELESGKPTLEIGKVLSVAAAAGIQLMFVCKANE